MSNIHMANLLKNGVIQVYQIAWRIDVGHWRRGLDEGGNRFRGKGDTNLPSEGEGLL